ncbi:demethoxyubiquinone hydroxylase family protein [Varunaivibrio sulfuroxidans]|uniref:3-demethoxyubiquinol 3-hydroxylase n=1 Tax=Varunaivibrio sulfuroxidans TaxID=1773489 RepID=A0A4R3J420_9PROT|nr:demethoxyubiquinone hydroxylase family protein [Varunaivibrio sulfuroxidans]TCS60589.1 ubiquinone biosynthesis monooxygenase Coq7 [Varunaivibrio sulfuroxidans]WES30079.1 demethoxyubiquinone hydroxylase family protein [Varunaivibrio sulfuroxidans]
MTSKQKSTSSPKANPNTPPRNGKTAQDAKTTPRGGRLPGDPTRAQLVERIIRVDQAGEYGAVRIYEGQLAVLGDGPSGAIIRHMAKQEEHHLATFDDLARARGARPTMLTPLWHIAGYALGAGAALLGEKAAMACTVAVEEAIDEHYAKQIEALGDDEKDLRETCRKFREEELEHRQTGLDHGARQAPGYDLLSTAIKRGSKLAIWLSERV